MLFIILLVFIGITLLQLVYYVFIFGSFSFAKKQNISPKKLPISIIICAKNEEENIKKYFPLIVSQNYPDYEIVLIDDASSDETLELFESYEKQYANVKLVKVQNNEAFWGNKKFALTLGIKAAKNEYLVFTDADCYPVSTDWLLQISSQFTKEKTIVLGYGAYEKVKNSFLNKIIRFDALLTAIQYFSWAKLGKPYMGIGRNLAYKKSEFFNVRGFMDHMKVRAGDDDLFINQAATASNTEILFSANSFTYTEAKSNFKDWVQQKRRNTATTHFYKGFDKFQLGLFLFSQISFFLLAIVLLLFQYQWIVITSILVFRYIFTWITLGYAAAKLKEKDVLYWYPLIELIVIFTQLNVFVKNIISKPIHWK
ncbi:MAG: glycosyltransferase [Flavobacterium sp.]|nr:glycosyltransferase [Flavobacterium sp.]MBP6073760.1 glycosyltransferase [Flavobacterium sp.]